MGTLTKYLSDFQAEIESAVNGAREAGIAAGVDVVSQRELLPVIDPNRNSKERALMAAAKASIPDGAEEGQTEDPGTVRRKWGCLGRTR